MKKVSLLDRLLLLATGLLAAYQIVLGLEGMKPQTTWFYTAGFGVLLVAGLLLIILGFEGLESQAVVIVSTLIPLCISQGLISEHFPSHTLTYLLFAVVGFGAIAITRYTIRGVWSTVILAVVHGGAGLIIFGLPIVLLVQGFIPARYLLVSLGGGLIGVGGLLLAFLKTGRPILPQKQILAILPAILFLMTLCFVLGFSIER